MALDNVSLWRCLAWYDHVDEQRAKVQVMSYTLIYLKSKQLQFGVVCFSEHVCYMCDTGLEPR